MRCAVNTLRHYLILIGIPASAGMTRRYVILANAGI